jgi:hypothetical protein
MSQSDESSFPSRYNISLASIWGKRHRLGLSLLHSVDAILSYTGLKKAIRLIYNTWDDLMGAHVLERNRNLFNLYQNKRCFLFGAGPSLNEIQFNLLAAEHIFACSFVYRHKMFAQTKPSFYVELEPPWSLFATGLNAKAYFSDIDHGCVDRKTIFFIRSDWKRFLEKRGIFSGRAVYYVKSNTAMTKAITLCHNLTRRITFMDGSIYFMIAAAIYMGFKELYLCGCGYTYQPLQSGHFFDGWSLCEDRPVDERHRIMRDYADALGVKIYNIVPEGFESPTYEGVTWENVVENVIHK